MATPIRFGLAGSLLALLCASASQTTAAGVGYGVAARHYQLEEWEVAATGFSQVLSAVASEQERLSARFFLSECQMQLGQYALARAGYQQLLQLPYSQYSTRALFRAGEAALFAGERKEGRELLRQFLAENPRDPLAALAICHLADQASESNNTDSALVLYRRVLDDYPHSEHVAQARLGLAKVFLAREEPERVSGVLDSLENIADEQLAAESLLVAGRALHEQGEYGRAVKKFAKATEYSATTGTAFRARIAAAWSLWRAEQFEGINEVVAPLAEQPQWLADYHYLTGMAAYGQEDWSSGAKHLSEAIRLRPDHPSRDAMIFYHGLCHLRQGRAAAARHLFQRLRAEHPGSAWLDDADDELTKLGLQSMASSEQEKSSSASSSPLAEESYIGNFYDDGYATSATPNPAAQNLERVKQLLDEAVGLQRDGRFDSAIAAYEELVAIESNAPERREGIRRSAKLHHQLKRHEKAVQLYRTFLQEEPESPQAAEALAALGWLQVAQGDLLAAESLFEDLLEKFPQSPQAAEAAYWLAGSAADEDDSEMAGYYLSLVVDWLNQHADGTARQRRLLAQTLALRCQLAARAEDWQTIRDIAQEALVDIEVGLDRTRLEFWQAEAEFRTKQFDQAREKFAALDTSTFGFQEEWVAMVPLRRAQLAARRQQWKEVLKLVDRLDREFPDFQLKYEADYLRGRAEAGLGNFSAARTAYQEVIASRLAESTETSVAARWMIGETYFHQQNYELARATYQIVIDQPAPASWQARAALQIGKCWELEEKWQEARAMYSEALQRWPDVEPQEVIQARLKWAESRVNVRR